LNEAPARPHRRPLWLGALVAWPVAPMGYALFAILTTLQQMGIDGITMVYPFIQLIFMIGLPIAALAMFLIGLPLTVWFRARGWLRADLVCLAAAGVGILAWSLFLVFVDGGPPSVGQLLAGAALGAVSGLVFCLTAGLRWRIRRP